MSPTPPTAEVPWDHHAHTPCGKLSVVEYPSTLCVSWIAKKSAPCIKRRQWAFFWRCRAASRANSACEFQLLPTKSPLKGVAAQVRTPWGPGGPGGFVHPAGGPEVLPAEVEGCVLHAGGDAAEEEEEEKDQDGGPISERSVLSDATNLILAELK